MPDLSIPEIVRQFNERQSQKSKPKRRPHSSSVYTTKSAARRKDNSNEKPSAYNYNAFITGTVMNIPFGSVSSCCVSIHTRESEHTMVNNE